MRKMRYEKYCETLREIVEKIKISERNPLIIIGWDMNKYNLLPAFEEFLDIFCVPSPPTRNERLDLIFINDEAPAACCSVVPPLENEIGTQSDHSILSTTLIFPHHHEFQWIRYCTCDMTEANRQKFNKQFCAIDWEELLGDDTDPSSMTVTLHNKINELTVECFPWRDRKAGSTDDPWINDEIRWAIRTRNRWFKKYQRSEKWRLAKQHTDKLIVAAKREFYEKSLDKFCVQGGGAIPYKMLKELTVPDRPKKWSINELKPKMTDDVLAEDLADFFVWITDEFEPLSGNEVFETFSNPLCLARSPSGYKRVRSPSLLWMGISCLSLKTNLVTSPPCLPRAS